MITAADTDSSAHSSLTTITLYDKLAASLERLIHCRIPGAIRDLRIEVGINEIWLRGHCATFFSKQTAQRAVMGVISDLSRLNLRNDIEVA